MKYQLKSQFDIELGKDGSKWKHDYIPENAAAVALKAHKIPGKSGAATPGAVKFPVGSHVTLQNAMHHSGHHGTVSEARTRKHDGSTAYTVKKADGSEVAVGESQLKPHEVQANGVTGSVGNMTDVSALRAAAKATPAARAFNSVKEDRSAAAAEKGVTVKGNDVHVNGVHAGTVGQFNRGGWHATNAAGVRHPASAQFATKKEAAGALVRWHQAKQK